ncbi:MAG: tetratricopeptide repeat protein [Bacteroidetes bacterium]|nr:tetratricopeptide repeat protein [Bacteroidota bacterium]
MRKSVLLLAFLVISVASFAQMKKDRTTAYNYWQKHELAKAKEYIDKASESPDAASDAKVWYYKGSIYLDLSVSPELRVLYPNALETAYESNSKAKLLDTKNEFKTEILTNLLTIAGRYYDLGVGLVQAANATRTSYQDAAANFEKSLKISSENNVIDTSVFLGLGISYSYAGDTANAIKAYKKLIEMGAKEPSAYNSLSNLYKGKGDYDNAFKYVKEGLELYPSNTDMNVTQVNLFIATKQHNKALESLFKVREKEPENVSIQYAIGVTYDLLKNDTLLPQADRDKYFKEAVTAYEKTIKMDSTHFDALFNLGVIYFNKGGDVINVANKLPLSESKKYDDMIAEGKNNLKMALPNFERAEKLNPNDSQLLLSLKEIYTRLAMMDKLQQINAKLNK